MQAHYFQHVPFEGLGGIEPWLRSANFDITATRFFESATLPALQAIDLLIVMGGPMSGNYETAFPWLVQEKKIIRDAIYVQTEEQILSAGPEKYRAIHQMMGNVVTLLLEHDG